MIIERANVMERYMYRPSLKQRAGSVVSSNPEQMAFRTALLSSLPAQPNPLLLDGDILKLPTNLIQRVKKVDPAVSIHLSIFLLPSFISRRLTSILSVVYNNSWKDCHIPTGTFPYLQIYLQEYVKPVIIIFKNICKLQISKRKNSFTNHTCASCSPLRTAFSASAAGSPTHSSILVISTPGNDSNINPTLAIQSS